VKDYTAPNIAQNLRCAVTTAETGYPPAADSNYHWRQKDW